MDTVLKELAMEIERKFLVDTALWTPRGAGTRYTQGYLSSAKERTVRVRREGDRAVLTIKGPTRGISRLELEYPIPLADAEAMFPLCEQPLIEKVRHAEEHGGRTWEIDVFAGENAGLVVAEVELAHENDLVDVPPWAIREVSDDPRYYNANLIANPYKNWI
jgi:adenylate cyclase